MRFMMPLIGQATAHPSRPSESAISAGAQVSTACIGRALNARAGGLPATRKGHEETRRPKLAGEGPTRKGREETVTRRPKLAGEGPTWKGR
jgi:hypothetical protein